MRMHTRARTHIFRKQSPSRPRRRYAFNFKKRATFVPLTAHLPHGSSPCLRGLGFVQGGHPTVPNLPPLPCSLLPRAGREEGVVELRHTHTCAKPGLHRPVSIATEAALLFQFVTHHSAVCLGGCAEYFWPFCCGIERRDGHAAMVTALCLRGDSRIK